MTKKSKAKNTVNSTVDTGRGVIKHNALAAMVTSKTTSSKSEERQRFI